MISIKNIFCNKNKIIIWSLIVFLLAFAVRGYWISQKQGIHVDEGYTHVISSFNEYNWAKNYEENHLYTGKEIKDITFKNTTSVKQTFSDLKELRKNNDYDFNHSNMYYSLYRIWMTNGNDVLSLKEFINLGCGLNLVFFSISFWLMYRLLRKLFDDSGVVPLGLAVAFLNTGAISDTLFLRPYQLQETIFIFLSLVFVEYYTKISKKENIISIKDLCILTLVLGLTILSGYFSLIYMGILGLVLLFISIKNKNYKTTGFLVGSVAASLIFALIIYPAYFYGFGSSRAQEAFAVINNAQVLQVLIKNLIGTWNTLVNFLFYLPIIILLIIGICKKNKNIEIAKLPLILITSAFVWFGAVMYLAPYKILRYVMPIFPIISLLIPYVVSCVKETSKKLLIVFFLIIFIINSTMATSKESYETLFRSNNPRRIPFGAVVENLNYLQIKNYKFIEKPETPVIFFNDMVSVCYVNLVPHFPDEQIYEFYEEYNINALKKYNHYFLLIPDRMLSNMGDIFSLPSQYKVVDEYVIGRFKVYDIIRK